MKISFVEPHLKIYGGIRRVIELANRLIEIGQDVTIFHSDGKPCGWMKCKAKIKSYDKVLKKEHDVIIYNDPNPIDYKLVKRAKAKLKVFYVLELYDKQLLKGLNFKIYLPWNKRMLILKKSLCSPYLKLSNATWEKEWLKENMNIDSKLLIGGVNIGMFHPVEVEKDPKEIRILCSGDSRERKGTKTILEAIEIAKKEEPRIVLDTYHGKGIPQEKMAEKYSSSDIFIEGSWQAGWNNPVAEAMACAVPIVCTDIGGVKDFAFHEKTALLVPPKNPEAMASAILRLIKDEGLREKLRENAYQHIRLFDWDKSAKRLEEILSAELSMADFRPAFVAPKDNALEVILESISRVLDVGYKIAGAILRLIRKLIRKTDIYSPCSPERFQTQQAQQNICDATDYILGNEKFDMCLDAGCGGNQYCEMLLKRCEKVIGCDLNPVEAPDTYKMDLLDLKFGNNTFDLIFCNQVIEHIYPKEHFKFLSELLRVCKPNGQILVLTPNQLGPTRFFEGNFITYLDADHKKEFNYLYARRIKKQIEKSFDCKIKIYGYSSFDSQHRKLIWLWSWLPTSFRKIAIKFPLLGRGIVLFITKSSTD